MSVELRIHLDDGGQLEELREWMRGHPGVDVHAVTRPPEPNSQGTVWDFLSVVCGAGGPVVAAVRALQLWVEARVTVVEIEVGDQRIMVTSPTAGTVLPQVVAAAQILAGETPPEEEAPPEATPPEEEAPPAAPPEHGPPEDGPAEGAPPEAAPPATAPGASDEPA